MRAVKEEMLGNEVGENPLSGGTSITYESGGDSLREGKLKLVIFILKYVDGVNSKGIVFKIVPF